MRKVIAVAGLLSTLILGGLLVQQLRSEIKVSQVTQNSDAGTVSSGAPRFKKAMIIVLENTSYDDAINQPFLASLIRRGAVLTRFSAETHPSQPNYIALISGSPHGVRTNDNVTIDARHIGDLLEAKGLQWKVYAEGYPGSCFLGARADGYARKHLPFLSFTDVQKNPIRCARIVDASQLSRDMRAGTLPEFSLYIPKLKNSGHGTGVSYADQWLSATFGPLLQDRRLAKDLLLVVTFDEGHHSRLFPSSNHILTVLLGDTVRPGSRSDKAYNHYSLLRLVEKEFGLGSLGENDAQATEITGIWK